MTASGPNPSNIALLAILGIGGYWFMTRRASAAGAYPMPTNGQGGLMPSAGLATAGRLFGGLASAFTNGYVGTATPAQTAAYLAANNSYNGKGGTSSLSGVASTPADDNSVFPDWSASNPSGAISYDWNPWGSSNAADQPYG